MMRFHYIIIGVLLAVSLGPVTHSAARTHPVGAAYGVNLIVNGGAEAGQGATDDSHSVSPPGWTVRGGLSAVQYNAASFLTSSSPGAPGRGLNFFAGGPSSARSSASQTLDLSADAGDVDHGVVTFSLSGYLGGYADQNDGAALIASFKDMTGTVLYTAEIGPVIAAQRASVSSLVLRAERGRLPRGVRTVTVTLVCQGSGYNDGYADNLSLVLTKSATPAPIFGVNVIVNGDAEAGAGSLDASLYFHIPGWTTVGQFGVVTWQLGLTDLAYLSPKDTGPAQRGKNYFAGGPNNQGSSALQTIDVSGASATIDRGKVHAVLSGYLGGFADQGDYAIVRGIFKSASGSTLGSLRIGPVGAVERQGHTGILPRSATGTIPVGTRQIEVMIQATRKDGDFNDGYADNLSLVLTP